MSKETVKGIKEVTVQRLPVPKDLTRKQYVELRMSYMNTIVISKKALKKAGDIYRDARSDVLSASKKLNDAEERLVEVFDILESPKLK